MTIGEYVKRRGLALRCLAIALLAVALAVLFVFPEYFAQITKWQRICLSIPVFLLYGILAMAKCPRCGASLGDSIHAAAMPFASDLPNACPRCGVSFSEPMRQTPGHP